MSKALMQSQIQNKMNNVHKTNYFHPDLYIHFLVQSLALSFPISAYSDNIVCAYGLWDRISVSVLWLFMLVLGAWLF